MMVDYKSICKLMLYAMFVLYDVQMNVIEICTCLIKSMTNKTNKIDSNMKNVLNNYCQLVTRFIFN